MGGEWDGMGGVYYVGRGMGLGDVGALGWRFEHITMGRQWSPDRVGEYHTMKELHAHRVQRRLVAS
jgi:hypothetical protein